MSYNIFVGKVFLVLFPMLAITSYCFGQSGLDNLAVDPGDTEATIFWVNAANSTYKVQQKTLPGGTYSRVGPNVNSPHSVPRLTNGTTYRFKITATTIVNGTTTTSFKEIQAKPIAYLPASGLTPTEWKLREKKTKKELAEFNLTESSDRDRKKPFGFSDLTSGSWYTENFQPALALTIDTRGGRISGVDIDGNGNIVTHGERRETPRVLLMAHQAIKGKQAIHGAFVAISLDVAETHKDVEDSSNEEVDSIEKIINGIGFGYLISAPAATSENDLSVGIGVFADFNVLTLKGGLREGGPAGTTEKKDLTEVTSMTSILFVATWKF